MEGHSCIIDIWPALLPVQLFLGYLVSCYIQPKTTSSRKVCVSYQLGRHERSYWEFLQASVTEWKGFIKAAQP